MDTINIITRCTRLDNILKTRDSIFTTDKFNITWYVVFDTSSIKDLDGNIMSELYSCGANLNFIKGEDGDFGHNLINKTIDKIEDGWVYIIDDDNIIHENFYEEIYKAIKKYKNKTGFVFNQKVGGRDFTGLDIRIASPENMRVQHIDMAQFFLHRKLISNHRIPKMMYVGDGVFIEELYKSKSEEFVFINKTLCHYNYLSKSNSGYCMPRVLIIGTQSDLNLKSQFYADFEATELKTKYIDNDKDLNKILQEFNPDSIITLGNEYDKFQNIQLQPYEVRKRWIHHENLLPDLGEFAYQCANHFILSQKYEENPQISFFTPIYNTGNKLWITYQSLKEQTYSNWEWVMVNDSTDGGKTLMIAEEIAKNDYRCKVYDFGKKSGGIVGESKYRAASLCNGKYLMELDHDDYLLPEAGTLMVEAFQKYPDAKFVYSDSAEVIEENFESITYPDGFCFGYGNYREERWRDKTFKVANTANINPKTIRHIVGVPNHFRAWDRVFYHEIGGHNRRLTIADDYELIVRTFLKTKMVRIPKLLYLQFYHNNNTQNATRADIQRRVKSIMLYYNEAIKNRFEELGVNDWAYEQCPPYPLMADSRFGEAETPVNYTMQFEIKYEYNWNALSANGPILT
jgi:glycosyltransferase involved in cell wall biosynthesis